MILSGRKIASDAKKTRAPIRDMISKIKIRIFVITAIALSAVAVFFSLLSTLVFISNAGARCFIPDCEKSDLSDVLEKEVLSEEDYLFIYSQTGLKKPGVDRCLAAGRAGREKIKRISEDYFSAHKCYDSKFAPLSYANVMEDNIEECVLEVGDIILTSSTEVLGVRVGHAGLVVDAERRRIVTAFGYGKKSGMGFVSSFTNHRDFIIFSPKASAETKRKVAEYAKKSLTGIKYSLFVGIRYPKSALKRTNCAHLVWYAYNRFGVDLDSDGGRMVSVGDLAECDKLEVIQTFGFPFGRGGDF